MISQFSFKWEKCVFIHNNYDYTKKYYYPISSYLCLTRKKNADSQLETILNEGK